jgi:hypothetical protein
MGFAPDAELIWGIPVEADETFWDEEADDWREFEGELVVRGYGHYADPDKRGILTSTRVEPIFGDAWEPTRVSKDDLVDALYSDKLYSKSNDQARAGGLDVNFYTDAGWWLVAGYG